VENIGNDPVVKIMKTITKISGTISDSTTGIVPFSMQNRGAIHDVAMRRRRITSTGLLIINQKTGESVLFPWAELEAIAAVAAPKILT